MELKSFRTTSSENIKPLPRTILPDELEKITAELALDFFRNTDNGINKC